MSGLFEAQAPRRLAGRMRPQRLDEIVGQDHLIGPNAPIGRMLAAGQISSMILWGPPGCGKTTLARLIAEKVDLHFEMLSAIFSGVADLRKIFEAAKQRRLMGRGTLLFIDEIHRFNRSQQDGFLPHVEDGTIVLVGATTENPSFELNAALLSRCQVFVLNRLHDGDGRYLLNMAEELFRLPPDIILDPAALTKAVQKRAPLYDKAQEGHYNLISALHKSLRGSDTDAGLYWLARMLAGGEEPLYIARRLVRFAVEDVGLADPDALVQTIAAKDAYDFLGSPEGELALAQAVIYLGTAP